jgi:hypothetical protein
VSTTTEEGIKKTANSSYKIIVNSIHSPGQWGSSEISIFSADGLVKRKLGSYTRNYPAHGMDTWYPFSRGNKDYALYSPDYTCTRVMELPTCKDIGGEEPSGGGFCPVEYYLPEIIFFEKQSDPDRPGSFSYHIRKEPSQVALVAGCFWGDDSSWKIQCLDISQIESGLITRDERFGYVPMPTGMTLAQTASLERDEETGAVVVTLAVMQAYDLATGKTLLVDPFR